MSRGAWQRVVTIALGVVAGAVATAGTLAVAVAGFTLSYDAIRKVGVASGVRPDWAWLLPVSIDGAMAVATVTAVVMSRMRRNPGYPWIVVIVGAGISIACNAVHATMRDHIQLDDHTAMAVSAIPAVMLALSVHLLVVLVDAAAQTLDQPATPTDQVGDQADQTPTMVAPDVEPMSKRDPATWRAIEDALYPRGIPYPPADGTTDQTPDLGTSLDEDDDQEPERPRPDADLVAEFRDQIMDGPLTRYRVEQITGASRRQAQRILDQMSDLNDQSGDQVSAEPSINGRMPDLEGVRS